MSTRDEQLDRLQRRIADLETALTAARQSAEVAHQARAAAEDSARRAWHLSNPYARQRLNLTDK